MTSPREIYVVNEDDKVIGTILDRDADKRSDLITRASDVWVFTSTGELLLQKRSEKKYRYPCCWDTSAGGIVDVGSNYEQTALNELSEELGVEKKIEDLTFLDKIFVSTDKPEFKAVYMIIHDGPFQTDGEEVADLQAFDKKKIHDMIQNKQNITPTFAKVYKILKKKVKKDGF